MIAKNKAKEVKAVKAWAALKPDGVFIGMMSEGVPRLYVNKAVGEICNSATCKIVRVSIKVL